MSMTDEEFRRLQAEFEGGPKPPSVVSTEAMAPETFEALQAEFEPTGGADYMQVAADNLGAPQQATTMENIRYGAGGVPQGYADIADMRYFTGQAMDAAADYIPSAVGQTFRSMAPTTAAALDLYRVTSQQAGQISERPGLKETKEVLAPEFEGKVKSPWAEAARTFGEWAGPGATAKAPKLATQGVKALPKIARSVVPDVTMGTTAAAGEAAIGYLSPEYAWVGELGGGLGGLALALATGKRAGLTKEQMIVLRSLDEIYDDPKQALAELKRRTDAGEIGTIGDLTRDDGVFDVENWSAKATPKGRRQAKATARDRIDQIYDEVTAPMRPPEGVTAAQAPYRAGLAIESELAGARAATERAKVGLEAEATAANEAAATARAEAENAAAAVDPTRQALDPGARPDVYSTEAAGRYAREQKDYIDNVSQPLWDTFDNGPDINVQPLRMAANDIYRKMTPEERLRMNDTYGPLVSEVTAWRGDVSPRAITLTLQEMKDTIAKADKMGWKERKLQEIVDALETTLDDPNVSQSYADAVAATKEGYDRFGPAFVGDVRKANRETPETLLQNLGITGDRGAATIRLIGASKVPELKADVAKYIRARAVREPNINESFLIEYEAVLDNLDPSVRREIQGLIDAEAAAKATDTAATAAGRTADRTAKDVERRQGGLQRTLAQTESGLKGDIRGQYAAEPNATIDRLLAKPDGATELKSLMDEITDLDEVASFKANLNDRMERMLFETTKDVDSGVVNSVNSRANAYRDYMAMQDSLVEAGVITRAEAKKMENALERTNTEVLRKASRAYDITQQADEHINLLASGGAAAILGPMPGAYSLMVGGAIRRSLNTLLRGKLMAKRLDVLSDYLNNPKKYLADLDRLNSPEAVEREFLTRLVGATQAAELMAAEEE
jgi:hypothetical protein